MSRLAERRIAARMEQIAPFRVVEVMERAWAVEATGRSVIHLVAGEPDFGTPAAVVDAASRAIADGHVHYTSSLGIPQLREAISQYYLTRLGAEVPPSRIVVTTGGSAALMLAFGATLDPGDQVLMSDPGYPCNRNLLRLYGAEPVAVQAGPSDNYQLSIESCAPLWNERTRGSLIGTPSNPTGSAIAPAELTEFVRWTGRQGGLCFVDEVYGELGYDRAPSTALSGSDEVFVVNCAPRVWHDGLAAGLAGLPGVGDRRRDPARSEPVHLRPLSPLSSVRSPRSRPRSGGSSRSAGTCSASGVTCWSAVCGSSASGCR